MSTNNPFPGLRPFNYEDNHLFFGRDEQITDLASRLRKNRFVAVVGTSGSGKSSLVRAGLLPELYGGTRRMQVRVGKLRSCVPGEIPFKILLRP